MKIWWIIILILGLVGSMTFIPFVKTTEGATTITGTIVTTEAWLGLPPVFGTKASPLANWCQAHGVTVTEDTVVFSEITKNVWGIVWARRSSRPPACYDFKNAIQKAWLTHMPETEVRRFIEAMTATDEVGRSRLVEAAVAQVLAKN
jgi:hypothetical protein